MKLRRDLLITFAVALSACSAAASSGPEPSTPSPELTASTSSSSSSSSSSTAAATSSTATQSTIVSTSSAVSTTSTTVLVGQLATGNRVLMVGDSILASTSRRYGNTMCQALVPLGWQLELDAESGRFIDFGRTVFKARLSAGWDVVVIMLGNNFDGNADAYRMGLEQLVVDASPRPVVLLTVTEFRPDRQLVNTAIRDVAASHANVSIVDWAARSTFTPDLLGGDGLHLTDVGRAAIAMEVAAVMGEAPQSPGGCLPTKYTDDSAGPVTGTTVRPNTGTTVRRPTATTTRPTATTTRPATTTATIPGTSPVTSTATETTTPTTKPKPTATTAAPPPTTAAPPPPPPPPPTTATPAAGDTTPP